MKIMVFEAKNSAFWSFSLRRRNAGPPWGVTILKRSPGTKCAKNMVFLGKVLRGLSKLARRKLGISGHLTVVLTIWSRPGLNVRFGLH